MTSEIKRSFEIISYAGEARTHAFNALAEAKKGNIKDAEELLKQANKSIALAHKHQTDLLFDEFDGKKAEVDLLLVHAQDHLMTSMLAIELLEEIIILYKNKEG